MQETITQAAAAPEFITLTFQVPRAFWRHMKVEAAKRDMTMRDLFRRSVEAFVGEPPTEADNPNPDPGDTQEI